MAIQRINPSQLFDSKPNGHSQGTIVESGKLAFFSGQVAWSPQHTAPPDSLAEQTQIVTANLQVCLDSVGATRDDIGSRVDTADLDWPLAPSRIRNVYDELTAAQ